MLHTSDYQHLVEYMEQLDIIDTHEHNTLPAADTLVTLDYILQHSYVGWCGVPTGRNPGEKAAFLEKVGANSYFRWLLRSLQRLYEFDGEIAPDNWAEISERISQAHINPNWYLQILSDKAKIQRAILDAYWNPGSDNGHPEIYAPTYRINAFVMSYNASTKDHNGNNALAILQKNGLGAKNFDDYLQAVALLLEQKKAAGCVALKSALAYDRDLSFGGPSKAEAEKVWKSPSGEVSPKGERAYQDFMFHFILGQAGRLDLPVQIHTGLGRIQGSNPMLLVPLIEQYPDTKFVLFHGGYPWSHEIGGLLHNYDNVYADLVWLPLISPTAAVSALHEWLETARTCEKISWGGDCWTAEETYGAVLAGRHVIARVLAEKVHEGYFSRQMAERICQRILADNARQLYSL